MSESGQKRSKVCTFEGVQKRVWGRKSADRIHSVVFWGVRGENDEKAMNECRSANKDLFPYYVDSAIIECISIFIKSELFYPRRKSWRR